MIDAYSFKDLVKGALTERQFEVLQLVGATFSKKEISKILVISVNTVEGHIDNISDKLKTDWTPATTQKLQRLTLIWEHYGKEIAEFSNIKLLTLEELLKKYGYKK